MSFSSASLKRAAEEEVEEEGGTPSPSPPFRAPVILRRTLHRRRNIAIDTWGLDVNGSDSTKTTTRSTASSTTTNNISTSNSTSSDPVTTAQNSPSSSPSPPFNIYKSLLRHPSLFPAFLTSLPLPSILALYAIDKELHYLFNLYSLSLIHLYARHHFPISSRVFSAALHPGLCISDPMLRPMDGRMWLARDVPGWRWVGMVGWREGIVRGILGELEDGGVAEWKGMEESLFKFWSLMDMPHTCVRRAYLADTDIWTDANVRAIQLFLLKLDMRFSHPVTGNGGSSLSHLLLSQQSLSTLYNVLVGRTELSYDRLETLVRYTYLDEDLDTDTYEWLLDAEDTNVPQGLWGVMMKEGRETHGERMESVVDMVIEEGVRRELHLQERLLDCVMTGYVDGDGRNLGRVSRKGKEKAVEKTGWPSRGERDQAIASLDKQLGLLKMKKDRDQGGDEMDLSH